MQSQLNCSLQCPCTQLNTSYGQLVHLQPAFHQVCSSDFASSAWILDVLKKGEENSLKYTYTRSIFNADSIYVVSFRLNCNYSGQNRESLTDFS
jgi:uncharacterized protein (DUF2225 family)